MRGPGQVFSAVHAPATEAPPPTADARLPALLGQLDQAALRTFGHLPSFFYYFPHLQARQPGGQASLAMALL